MNFSRSLTQFVAVASLMSATSFSFAADKAPVPQTMVSPAAIQAVVLKLQAQMQQISNSIAKQLAAQDAKNQEAIATLQKETQTRFVQLQAELSQLQAQTSKEIAQVQKEVQQEARIK